MARQLSIVVWLFINFSFRSAYTSRIFGSKLLASNRTSIKPHGRGGAVGNDRSDRWHHGSDRSDRSNDRDKKLRGSDQRPQRPGELACPDDDFLQRNDFIEYAKAHKKGKNNVVFSAADNLMLDAQIRATVPQAEKMMGWNVKDQKCMGEFDRGFGPACALVDDRWKRMHAREYNQYLNARDSGKLCHMNKKYGVRTFSRSQLTALVAYSADEGDTKSFYNVLNEDLHLTALHGKTKILEKWSVFLYWLLGALNCINTQITPKVLYRGVNIPSGDTSEQQREYYKGRYVMFSGIASSTGDENYAAKLAMQGRGGMTGSVVFEIVPSLAYSIAAFSKYHYEDEYIFPPMSLFKVVSVEMQFPILRIKLVQQDRSITETHCMKNATYVY